MNDPRPMRLAYLTSQYPAPSHTFVQREIAALREAGVEVHTFSVRPPPEEEWASVDAGERERTYALLDHEQAFVRAHVHQAMTRPRRYLRTLRDALRHRVGGARAALWSVFHFAEAIVLAQELERRDVTHLHNHFANSSAAVGYLASRHLGLPWSVTLHGSAELDYPAGPLLAAKIEHARFVACASHYMRSQAMRSVDPEQWSKLILVRCGVSVDRVVPREERGDRLRVLTIGRLSPEKGQLGLLHAFRAVLDAGIDAELTIAGEGPLRSELEAQVDALGLRDRCVFAGRCSEEEIFALLASADVFALSSFIEGLPVVLLEAMAAGVPVIAPALAGIPELVEPEHAGLLFPTGDFAALAHGLVRLARDPELRDQLRAAARARVLESLTAGEVVRPLLEAFRSVHAGSIPDGRVLPHTERARAHPSAPIDIPAATSHAA